MNAQEQRRLLELAAKAAGVEHEGFDEDEGRDVWWIPDLSRYASWNPIDDDGDALRLSVRLRLSVDHNHTADQQRWVSADRNGCEGCYSPVSCVEDEFDEQDRSAATRLAIVRAAAAIGEKMEEEK